MLGTFCSFVTNLFGVHLYLHHFRIMFYKISKQFRFRMARNNNNSFDARCRQTMNMIETWAENTCGGLHWFDVSFKLWIISVTNLTEPLDFRRKWTRGPCNLLPPECNFHQNSPLFSSPDTGATFRSAWTRNPRTGGNHVAEIHQHNRKLQPAVRKREVKNFFFVFWTIVMSFIKIFNFQHKELFSGS